jgi:hypothetical protein
MSVGPANWTSYPFRHLGVYLDGTQIESGAAYPLGGLQALSGSVAFDTLGNSQIVQTRTLGAKAPLGVSAGEIAVRMNVKDEADYKLFLTRCERGEPVEFWPDWPLFETWSLALRDAGQTEFQTRRKYPWALSGVTHVTRPPLVDVDGTSQTIVTAGTPGAGEVKVLETSGYGTLTAPAALSGDYMTLAYPPVLDVLILSVGMSYEVYNRLEFEVAMQEVILRRFN